MLPELDARLEDCDAAESRDAALVAMMLKGSVVRADGCRRCYRYSFVGLNRPEKMATGCSVVTLRGSLSWMAESTAERCGRGGFQACWIRTGSARMEAVQDSRVGGAQMAALLRAGSAARSRDQWREIAGRDLTPCERGSEVLFRNEMPPPR